MKDEIKPVLSQQHNTAASGNDDVAKVEINKAIGIEPYEAPNGYLNTGRPTLTAMHIGLFLLVVFATVFIAFITMAKSIQVTAVTPNLNQESEFVVQPARLQIHSLVKLPLGNRVLLMPGEHPISLFADGFTPLHTTLTVNSDTHQQFDVVLSRLPGSLIVNVTGDIQATAVIDGDAESAQTVPGQINNITAGVREISVDADLYRPFSTELLIQGKNQQQSLDVKLEPAWGEYTFTSKPDGADIYIDDVFKGRTPAQVKIEEGMRKFVIKEGGFKPFESDLLVVAQESLSVPLVTLIPANAEISITSEPTGAAVILNDDFVGVAPISIAVSPNSNQTLKVYKPGHKVFEGQYRLNPEEKTSQQIKLSPEVIGVELSVSPADASVYVDGTFRGKGSQLLSLTSLPHEVSVQKQGYVTQQKQIIPTPNSQQILRFQLLTPNQHYWAQIPSSYTNRFGHQMKLFKELGMVQLGSSRKEDGRRANEVVYQAQLTKPFYVALHETSNKQFRQFKANHSAGNYKGKSLDANKAPALNITWQQAAQYCNWLSKQEGLDPFYKTVSGIVSGMNKNANGYRLLTEAEWAWLARNTDNGVLTYPWGNEKTVPMGKKIGNFADKNAKEIITFTLDEYQDGYTGPAPVGRFPPNHRGLYDLDGNASEWVNDWYSAKGSSELVREGIVKDPLGPSNGELRVVRGASWARGYLPQLRLAYRDYGAKGSHDIGFRVARYAGLNNVQLSKEEQE